MLTRISISALLALSTTTQVVALPSSFSGLIHWARGDAPSQCSSGTLQCCQSTEDRGSNLAISKAVPYGFAEQLKQAEGDVGLDCVTIEVGGSCDAERVCCQETHPLGLVAVGCTDA